MLTRAPSRRFMADALADYDEPVRRYFTHAMAESARLARGVRLRLRGRVRVGAWLDFDSTWEGDGRSFSWRAVAGPGPLALLQVHDGFTAGTGFMDVRLRALPLPLVHATGPDVNRSAAGRAALEAPWAPMALLPERGVEWHAKSSELIVATWDVPPERPELHIRLGPGGEVRAYEALRWRDTRHGYLPFGADVHEERSFGTLTVPSRLSAGWGHGTGEFDPFFEAEVTSLALMT